MKLPSDVSKATVYRDYVTASETLRESGEDVRVISYRQFHRLWQELVPFVTTMNPSSDPALFAKRTLPQLCDLQTYLKMRKVKN